MTLTMTLLGEFYFTLLLDYLLLQGPTYINFCYLWYFHSRHSVPGWYIQNSVAHVTHGCVLAYCPMTIQFLKKKKINALYHRSKTCPLVLRTTQEYQVWGGNGTKLGQRVCYLLMCV